MQKFLITGFSGFVSRHFLEYLDRRYKTGEIEVLGIDINQPRFSMQYSNFDCSFEELNLLNLKRLKHVVEAFMPDYILHLASFSSVAFSWKEPVLSFQNNMNIFLNLVEALKECNLECRLLSVGSSEEYGIVSKGGLPLREEHALNPVSPYAAARVTQELLSKIYVDGFGLDIVMTRSFNHIGPYQDENFVVSSFAKQLMSIKHSGNHNAILYTGDVEIIRDFVDVHDVVRAYHELLLNGRRGEIYNICSGIGTSLRSIIEKMTSILEMKVEIEVKKEYLRPNDNPIIIGSSEKIERELNWKRKYSLDKSLKDILNYWSVE